ncbi:transglycosylase domain-containing protein [Acidocella sp.]|uniref:transglycosylase domain-containing protein n=1 Tax=Acidocella sp. TaxID=50710 RepID=UPI002612A913|nr:transglycosylase domain-containing protein [Acidocella sp.]
MARRPSAPKPPTAKAPKAAKTATPRRAPPRGGVSAGHGFAWPALSPRARYLARLGWSGMRLLIIGSIWGAVILGLVVLWFTWNLPNPNSALTQARRPAILLLDPAGAQVARFGDASGQVVTAASLPPYVAQSFIDIEDKRFYAHGAFDTEGLARALFTDLAHKRVVQGGSTLTQQVAKTLFLGNERTLRRKVQEAVLALWLTRHYTPDEILSIYLNRVYLGEGAYGVDAAARLYFNEPASRLTLAQAAILAGLPKAPSSLNPIAAPDAAAQRGQEVLSAMVAAGDISPAQEAAALPQLANALSPTTRTSWYALWVMQSQSATLPEGEDITFTTTFSPHDQKLAETALNLAIEGQGPALNVSQGAVVVLDAKTGAVRALVGGVGDRLGYNRATLARRQTGSAIKPIVWLAGLRAGLTPTSILFDGPLDLRGYRPHDYEAGYRGDVTMSEALADSMNTVAIRILLRAGGARRVIAVANQLGLDDHFPDDATMALGSGGVGVLQLAGAYATFFNGGKRVTPYAVTAINGAPAAIPPPVPVADPTQAQEVADMMRAVVTGGTGKNAYLPGIYTAGKTGTTQDYRDAWFVGYAQGDIIAVWVGNDDNSPTKGVLGGLLPAQIFKNIAANLQ